MRDILRSCTHEIAKRESLSAFKTLAGAPANASGAPPAVHGESAQDFKKALAMTGTVAQRRQTLDLKAATHRAAAQARLGKSGSSGGLPTQPRC